MEHGVGGVVYNIATGIGRPIRTLLEALVARSRAVVRIQTDEALLRPLDRPFLIGDASRLRLLTGWVPTIDFDRMLDDLLKYWRETVQQG